MVLEGRTSPTGDETVTENTSDEILEGKLREISKNITSYVQKRSRALSSTREQVQGILSEIIDTAGSPNLSITHGAAACNALSAILEWATSKGSSEVQAVVFSRATFISCLEVYYQRAETTKAKPLKQLLSSVTNLMVRCNDPLYQKRCKEIALAKAVAVIHSSQSDIPYVKSSMQIIDYLLRKSLVSTSDISSIWVIERRADMEDTFAKDYVPGRNEFYEVVIQETVLACLKWLPYPNIAPNVGCLISSLILSSQSDSSVVIGDRASEFHRSEQWLVLIRRYLAQRHDLLDAFGDTVLPNLLETGAIPPSTFLETLPVGAIERGDVTNIDDMDLQLTLICIKYLLKNKGGRNEAEDKTNILLEPTFFGITFVTHQNPTIRLTAFSTVAASALGSSLFPNQIIELLQYIIPGYHNEVDPRFRQEFLAILKQIWTRLCSSIRRLRRACQEHSTPEHSRSGGRGSHEDHGDAFAALSLHLDFIQWYVCFLCEELSCTASHQRHYMALDMLSCVYFTKGEDCAIVLYPETANLAPLLERMLLGLATDAFDDIRFMAMQILKDAYKSGIFSRKCALGNQHISRMWEGSLGVRNLLKALSKAESRMRATGRADYSDGVGWLYAILFSTAVCYLPFSSDWHDSQVGIMKYLVEAIEEGFKTGLDDPRRAMIPAPFLGHVSALRYIFSDRRSLREVEPEHDCRDKTWRKYVEKAIDFCEKAWEAVRGILCVDSPEGNEIGTSVDDNVTLNDKDALSFSWRTLKESSLLLQAILATDKTIPPESDPRHIVGLGLDDFERLGHLILTQLAELRHRGAFSTVAQTFAACCLHCSRHTESKIQGLPRRWYKQALNLIVKRSSALTRRSAGLPAMVVGILTTASEMERFEDVFQDLKRIAGTPVGRYASGEVRLPQVHALNCLKDVFTDTRLASVSEAHAADCLSIAANCLDSELWPIRNSGLMLFKALLTRLNRGAAVTPNKPFSGRSLSGLFYRRYPNMVSMVKTLLHSALSTYSAEDCNFGEDSELRLRSTQRVFAALEVLQTFGLPQGSRSDLLELLWQHVISSSWMIREKAAETFCSVLPRWELDDQKIRMLTPDWTSHNELHGRLLCVRLLGSDEELNEGDSGKESRKVKTAVEDLLDEIRASNKPTFGLRDKEARWIRWLIVRAGDFDDKIRAEGASSILQYFRTLYSLQSNQIRPPPGLYICLYDFLTDDDEEVREIATKATSVLLSNNARDLSTSLLKDSRFAFSPSVAATELLNALGQLAKTSIVVWLEAVRKVTGVDDSLATRAMLLSLSSEQIQTIPYKNMGQDRSSLPLSLRPFKDLLSKKYQINDETFAVEKQNLYVDEIQEGRRWTQLMANLRPDSDPIREKAAEVLEWIHQGLLALLDELQTTPDPLKSVDWMEEPDALTLIIRLVFATKAQADWHTNEVHVDEPALLSSRSMWAKVCRLGKRRLHPLVYVEVQRSVMGKSGLECFVAPAVT